MEKKKKKFDGWLKCCFFCPDRKKSSSECFGGKSYYLCPKYKSESRKQIP